MAAEHIAPTAQLRFSLPVITQRLLILAQNCFLSVYLPSHVELFVCSSEKMSDLQGDAMSSHVTPVAEHRLKGYFEPCITLLACSFRAQDAPKSCDGSSPARHAAYG